MTTRSILILAILCLLVSAGPAAAQREYGDGFGIGGVLLPSGSPVLLGTTRIGDDLGLEFSLALDVFDDDHTSSSEIGAAIGLKKYLTGRSQFQPFFGGRFGFRHSSVETPGGDWDDTRFGLTAALGGEYFLTRKLSLETGIELGMYFGSFELETHTRLAALFYL